MQMMRAKLLLEIAQLNSAILTAKEPLDREIDGTRRDHKRA